MYYAIMHGSVAKTLCIMPSFMVVLGIRAVVAPTAEITAFKSHTINILHDLPVDITFRWLDIHPLNPQQIMPVDRVQRLFQYLMLEVCTPHRWVNSRVMDYFQHTQVDMSILNSLLLVISQSYLC